MNGSGTPGQAALVAHALQQVGFAINGTGNAPSFQYPTSIVEYPTGLQAAAQTVADHVIGGAEIELNTQLPAGAVELITGASLQGIQS